MQSIFPTRSFELEVVTNLLDMLGAELDALYATTDLAYSEGPLYESADALSTAYWHLKRVRTALSNSNAFKEPHDELPGSSSETQVDEQELPPWSL